MTLFLLPCFLFDSGFAWIDDRPLKTLGERKRCRAERKTRPESELAEGQINTGAWKTQFGESLYLND